MLLSAVGDGRQCGLPQHASLLGPIDPMAYPPLFQEACARIDALLEPLYAAASNRPLMDGTPPAPAPSKEEQMRFGRYAFPLIRAEAAVPHTRRVFPVIFETYALYHFACVLPIVFVGSASSVQLAVPPHPQKWSQEIVLYLSNVSCGFPEVGVG